MQQFFVHSLHFHTCISTCPIKHVIYFYVKGDWHQYDDIICKATSKGYIPPQNPSKNVQGRDIGNIMLDTIFDLLQNCTDIHLKNFLIQLKQFFDTYGNPFVYEDTPKQWNKYGENEVRKKLTQHAPRNIPEIMI